MENCNKFIPSGILLSAGGQAESGVEILVSGMIVAAVGHPAGAGIVVPSSPAEHAVGAGLGAARTGLSGYRV